MMDNKRNTKGDLYVIPVPIADNSWDRFSDKWFKTVRGLKIFAVERTRTARRFIAQIDHPTPIDSLEFFEMDKHNDYAFDDVIIKKLESGNDIGLMSEAGCPGIADPGSRLVKMAHRFNIKVIPIEGPSSILLALMASGLNGQAWCFHGYLSAKKTELVKDLKNLSRLAITNNQTQIFIEAPHRNINVIEAALNHLTPNTLFGVVANLQSKNEFIRVKEILDWRQENYEFLHKQPCVFLLGT